MNTFDKPPKTTEEHIALLKERGLIIDNMDRAFKYIKHIGYYRLTGYMYPFQLADKSHKFKENVTFDMVIRQYLFDKKLRLLILDYIERLEVSIRAQVSDTMSLSYGAHWYLNDELFDNKKLHSELIMKIKSYCADPNEVFLKNYYFKYNKPEFPPSWMVMETFSMGTLSSIFGNIKAPKERGQIANCYNAVPSILETWLDSLNFIRNCCAHHSRLWNKKIPFKPSLPSKKANKVLFNITDETNQRIYGILSCMLYMIKAISPNSKFKERLFALFAEYSEININYMGFVDGWKDEPIWGN